MFNQYPYTDFHELNLDYILDLCRRTMGLHLVTSGDFLKLVNQAGDDISKLKVTYADKALTDMDGHDIRAFILDAGVDGRRLVFDRGNGEYVSITVPYATSAEQDVNGVAITDYVKGISVSGDNVLITFGNGTTTAITVPFATKASTDTNGKSLTTYVAELSTGNDKLIVKDGDGVTLAELTIPYAVKARNDYDGDDIRTTYGTDLTVGQTTVILRDKETNVLSEITVPYAVSAQTDNNGAPFRSSYGSGLTTGSNKVQLTAPNGTVLSDITVPFASTAADATNAIESVSVSGDNIVFTTYGGQSFSITCPYAVKALKDDLNNTLSHTYIANAVNDPLTGKITFYAQDGSVIAEMTPTVDRATHDNLGNDIVDYIKSIVTDPNSNYVTVTHGDGTADSLTINYATKAWKDTYGNVIGNVYIRSLSIITDSNTGKKVLVAYNGELSELFRIELDSETAVNDVNGTPITDYVVDVTLNGTDLDVEHGDGTVDTIALPTGGAQVLNDLTDVNITSPADGNILIYAGNTDTWVNGPVPAVPDALDDLTDVTITTPANGNVLKYDSNADAWINSGLNLNELSDVTDNFPYDGNILIYNGTGWITRQYRNDINIGELYLSTNTFTAPSLSVISNSMFSDLFTIRIYDSNGNNERTLQPIAYYAEEELNGIWSRDKFYYACKRIVSSQVNSMRAYFYFSTGTTIYKITLTANAGDTNFTVGTVITINDIFS